MAMKLWLISQSTNTGYDTYDSAVVAAETEDEAIQIHPSGYAEFGKEYATWADKPEQVQAQLIGTAVEGTKAGIVCASFNAG